MIRLGSKALKKELMIQRDRLDGELINNLEAIKVKTVLDNDGYVVRAKVNVLKHEVIKTID